MLLQSSKTFARVKGFEVDFQPASEYPPGFRLVSLSANCLGLALSKVSRGLNTLSNSNLVEQTHVSDNNDLHCKKGTVSGLALFLATEQ
jgi:hypothetical protein